LSVTDDDPRTVKEAVDSEDGKLWKEAMVDEMASLHKNEAWDLVELPAGNDKEIIQDLKTQLSSKFDMKDLGAANYILGMEIKRDRAKRKLWLNQRKYVETILQRFNM